MKHIHLDGAELDRWQWVSLDQLADYLIPRVARRIHSVASLDAPGSTYLEHGEQPNLAVSDR